MGGQDNNLAIHFKSRSINQCLIASPNGVIVDKGNMNHVKLVLNTPGVMAVPVVLDFTVDKGAVDVILKERQIFMEFVNVSIPQIDETVLLSDFIMLDVIAVQIPLIILAVGGNKATLAFRVELDTLERALNAAVFYLAGT